MQMYNQGNRSPVNAMTLGRSGKGKGDKEIRRHIGPVIAVGTDSRKMSVVYSCRL